jgi:hypothetical protein
LEFSFATSGALAAQPQPGQVSIPTLLAPAKDKPVFLSGKPGFFDGAIHTFQPAHRGLDRLPARRDSQFGILTHDFLPLVSKRNRPLEMPCIGPSGRKGHVHP